MRVERLEGRALMAADSLGVTPLDTGEFLLGKVVVTPVLFESNGTIDFDTENWDAASGEIDQVLAKITEGVNWWSTALDQLNTVHDLEFTVDDAFARNPFETGYEPILGSSEQFPVWVGEFLQSNGYGVGRSLTNIDNLEQAVREFNHDQRIKNNADWSFTIFVVDSSDDSTGFFKAGRLRGAFAFAGGLFIVMPSTRPASTVAHEMGHIFWARDEYSAAFPWQERRGYYDAQNYNSASNDTPGFVQDISIMRGGDALLEAYQTFYTAEATLAHVGWRDSDGDGIFDLADVPLDLQGSGYFDSASSTYRFYGTASAVPLMNQNSSGPQSDITFNRISRLEYRLDEGPWQTAAQPDKQIAILDETITITQPFQTIDWRVVDDSVGVTSEIIRGTPLAPAFPSSSLTGISFLDSDGDGMRDLGERALAGASVVVMQPDGSPLFSGQVVAPAFSNGEISQAGGATLHAAGDWTDGRVGVQELFNSGGERTFHWWDPTNRTWYGRWSELVAFEASLDQPVGFVTLDAIPIDQPGFLRIEAYDANGQFLSRVTSQAIELGQSASLAISDPAGRIASIRAYGHAGTSIGLRGMEFGFHNSVVTDPGGGFRLQNLADGTYRVELVAENVIHQFDESSILVDVVGGVGPSVMASARRVDSIRYNSSSPYDVNLDGSVSSRDALVVINDLNRNQPRRLSPSEVDGFAVDTTNDGFVSALDALLVINFLARQIDGASGEQFDGWVISSGVTWYRTSANLAEGVRRVEPRTLQLNAVGEKIACFDFDPQASSGLNAAESESSEPEFSRSSDLLEPFVSSFI